MVDKHSLEKFDLYCSWIENKDPAYFRIYIGTLFSDSAQDSWKEGMAFALEKGASDEVVRNALKWALVNEDWKRFDLVKSMIKDPEKVKTALSWLLYKRVNSRWPVTTIEKVLELGADPNYVLSPEVEYSLWTVGQRQYYPYTGCGPVLHRTKEGSKRRAILLKAGADPNLKDCDGYTLEEVDFIRNTESYKKKLMDEDYRRNKGTNGFRDDD